MRKILAGLFCLCLALSATPAKAASAVDEYPNGPLTLVVVYTPGGATDLQARISAIKAQDEKYFGQPMVILNKPGAGGMSGWNWFMDRGSKDGLTITAYNMPLSPSSTRPATASIPLNPWATGAPTRPCCAWPRTASSRLWTI